MVKIYKPIDFGDYERYLQEMEASGGGGGQPHDATLDALAALNNAPGLVEQVNANLFTKRALGIGAATSVPTRADADVRYAPINHLHTISDIVDLTPVLVGQDARIDALEVATGSARYETRAQMSAALADGTVPAGVEIIEILGDQSQDGLRDLFGRVPTEPDGGDYEADTGPGAGWFLRIVMPQQVEFDDSNILDEDGSWGRPPDVDGLPTRDWMAWPYVRQVTLPANPFTLDPASGYTGPGSSGFITDGKTVTVNFPAHALRSQYDWRGFTGANGVKEYVHFHDASNGFDQSIVLGTVGAVTLADPFTTAMLPAPFETTFSDIVTVNWPTHGGRTGWSVKITGATTVNGIPMPDGYYRIDSVVSPDAFRIDRGIPATGVGAGGGPAVTMVISEKNNIITGQYEVFGVAGANAITIRMLKSAVAALTGGGATVKATVWTEQADLFFDRGHKIGGVTYPPAWVKDDVTAAPIGIIRKPKIPIVGGGNYEASALLAGVVSGNARFKFDNVPGDGDQVSAAAGSSNGTYASTISGGGDGSDYVRIELSPDFVGEVRGPISVRPSKVHLLAASPEGAAFVISAADANGPWTGHAGKIALKRNGAWKILSPRPGQRVYVKRLKVNKYFNGTSWVQEHPGIIADYDSVYDRYLRPPYNTPSAEEGTPWGYPVPWKGLAVSGALTVFSAGGFKYREPMLGMLLYARDVSPSGLGASQGISAGGGFRRLTVEQAIELVAPLDTGEVQFTGYWADKRGIPIDWRAATTGFIGRMLFQVIGPHPISGEMVHQGRVAEIIGAYVPGGGGELLFRMAPGGQPNSAIAYALKLTGPHRWSDGHCPAHFFFTDLNAGLGKNKQVDHISLGFLLEQAGVVMDNPTNPILDKHILYMDAEA